MIDMSIIFIIIFLPLMSPLVKSMTQDISGMSLSESFQYNQQMIDNNAAMASTINFMIYVLMFAYFVIFEYKLGQTPGKMILNQYLISSAGNDKPGLMRIMLRNAIIFFWILWLVDGSYLVFTGRRLSDNFSKTTIVEEIRI